MNCHVPDFPNLSSLLNEKDAIHVFVYSWLKSLQPYVKQMKQSINPGSKAPAPLGAYSHALRVGQLLFVAGQGARDPKTGKEAGVVVDAFDKVVSYDIEVQTEAVIKNLATVLDSAGLTLQDVVDVTVFLCDMNDFAKYNQVYSKHFTFENAPARTTVQVAGLPGKNHIEIKAVAAFRDGSLEAKP